MIKIKEEAVLITPKDIPPSHLKLQVYGTFNPGAVRMKNGDIVLYVRVLEKLKQSNNKDYYFSPRCKGKNKCKITVDKFHKSDVESSSMLDIIFNDGTKRLTYISHLRRIILDETGMKVKMIDRTPSFGGIETDGELGIEDPRITKIGKKYYMTYVALSREANVSTFLAVSSNCKNWKRLGVIFREQNKDVVLFPEKINNKYYAFNRPEGSFQFSQPNILLSNSPDLLHWGEPKEVHLSRKGEWDSSRVGAGAPPIKTKKGWLLIYHGVLEREKRYKTFFEKFKNFFISREKESIYAAGAALLDTKNPRKLIAKSQGPIIYPTKKYEKEGLMDNVFFPTGLILDKNEEDLLIFAGGADKVTTVKKVSLKDVLGSLRKI